MWRKAKTVTRSFRISEEAIAKLEEDANEQGVSLNTLVNQLFISYASFDHYVRKLHMIKLTAPTARFMVEASPEETAVQAGRYAAQDIHKIFMLAKYGKICAGGTLEFLKDLSTYGRWFEYSEVESERKHTVTLMHEFGSRWSVFLASYVRGLFETMGTKLEVSSTDASVTFELEKSQSPASALGQLA